MVSLEGGMTWDESPLALELGGQIWKGQEHHCSSEGCSRARTRDGDVS